MHAEEEARAVRAEGRGHSVVLPALDVAGRLPEAPLPAEAAAALPAADESAGSDVMVDVDQWHVWLREEVPGTTCAKMLRIAASYHFRQSHQEIKVNALPCQRSLSAITRHKSHTNRT